MTGSKYYETLLESLSDIETMSDDAMGTPPSSLGRRFSLTSSELTPDSLSRSFSNGSPLSSPHFPSTPTSISCQTGSDGWFVHHHGLPIETSDGERNFRTEFAPFNDAPTKSPHDMVETCHPSDFDWVPSNGGNPSCYGPNTLVSDRMMPAFQDLSLAFGTCLGRPFGDNHIHSAFENIVGSSSEGSRAPIAMTSAVVNNFPILPSFEAGSTACPDMSWPNARSSLSSETTVPWTSLVSGLSARTDPKPMQLRSSALKSASMLDIRCMGSQGSPVPSPEAEMVPDIKREEDVSSARFPKYNHVQRAIRKCVMSSKPDIKAIRREKRGSAASKRKSKREKVILPSKNRLCLGSSVGNWKKSRLLPVHTNLRAQRAHAAPRAKRPPFEAGLEAYMPRVRSQVQPR